ncbi:MAG: LacI family DNA-binding transcriptional regulator [Lachnospiraceae bacterium]|nr:LacI family DNA-binding transcriptional regulator [Lachnospiraceae bacterium]
MTKISDIAKAMNLSEATVSNAFTGKGRMKPETRDAILTCAREMGYQFKTRTAVAQKKKLIVVTEGIDAEFITLILSGILQEAARHQLTLPIYSLEISQTDDFKNPDPDLTAQKLDRLLYDLNFDVSGILYIAQYPRRLDGLFETLSVPVVFAFCTREDGKDAVHYDDRQGAQLAVNALLSENRQRIAMISGPINSIGMYHRTIGYQQALMEHDLPYDPQLVRIGDWDEESGYRLTTQLLEEKITFDAVFAQNDSIGVGVARAIREHGLHIPQDISIIGFDDSPYCYHTFPALTSIQPPLVQIGQTALQRLLAISDRISSNAAASCTLLPCTLIRRGSTGQTF